MKSILRNLSAVFFRFKLATVLNVLGLSFAFTAFLLIMMQLRYDYDFDRCHPDAERIFRLEFSKDKLAGGYTGTLSRPLGEAFAKSSPYIEDYTFQASEREFFFSVEKQGVLNSFTEKCRSVLFNYPVFFGFDMTEGDVDALKEPGKVIIPLSLAEKVFGEEAAVGKQLKGREESYTVGGVYRDFPLNSSVLNIIYVAFSDDSTINSWGYWAFDFFMRLTDASLSEQVVAGVKNKIDLSEYGIARHTDISRHMRLTPLCEMHYTDDTEYDTVPKANRQTLFLLLCIGIAIVLIASVNFMNFSMALVPARIRSINTRKVLGGSTFVLRMSLIGEAIVVCFVSFLISLGFVWLLSFSPVAGLIDANIGLKEHRELVFLVFAIALVTGLLAGGYPAWYMTSFSPALVLKGNYGFSPSGRSLRNVLIGIQYITSFALIIGALFMYLQYRFMQTSYLGYDKDVLITSNINDRVSKSREFLKNEIGSFSGIEGMSLTMQLLSSRDFYTKWGLDYRDARIILPNLIVDPSFLRVLGIQLTEGRDFLPEDETNGKGAYIFNERARAKFDLELNEVINGFIPIVGFISDIKIASFRQEVVPMAFYVMANTDSYQFVCVRVKAGSDMMAAKRHIEKSLKKIDPEYVFEVRFYDDILNSLYEKERKLGFLITLFSCLAIFISIMGVFGMVMFEGEYRRREVGIRKVFGANGKDILLLFNNIYVRILCICFILAVPLAWYAVDKWLENFVYKAPMYWWVYLFAFFIVSMITVFTVIFQSWRTAIINPINTIRSE